MGRQRQGRIMNVPLSHSLCPWLFGASRSSWSLGGCELANGNLLRFLPTAPPHPTTQPTRTTDRQARGSPPSVSKFHTNARRAPHSLARQHPPSTPGLSWFCCALSVSLSVSSSVVCACWLPLCRETRRDETRESRGRPCRRRGSGSCRS